MAVRDKCVVILSFGSGAVGFYVGPAAAAHLCSDSEGGGSGGRVNFDKPCFSNLRLEAQPNPVNKNSTCCITLYWTGTNTSSSFSRAGAWYTQWSEESDGKPVSASVELSATKGRETYQLQQAPDTILVEVRPN